MLLEELRDYNASLLQTGFELVDRQLQRALRLGELSQMPLIGSAPA